MHQALIESMCEPHAQKLALFPINPPKPQNWSPITWSVAFSRLMSETLSEGISTLMRRMLPHGSLRTLLMTSMA